MNERPALSAPAGPAELTDEELLQITAQAQIYRFQATAGDPVQYEPTEAQLLAAFRAVIAADRARRAAPPAEGELTDYELEIAYGSAYTPAWDISEYCGVHLDGLRAVAAAALAKRFPPADGEVTGRPPLHIAITHQPKTTPPAEGELGELVEALKGDAACCKSGQHDLSRLTADQLTRAAELLERLAGELATLRSAPHA